MKGLRAEKVFITMKEMMEQMDMSDKTLYRLIDNNDLPDFSYGAKKSKKKGWHIAVLERHALEKYEKSNSRKNARHIAQIRGEDMAIVPLRSSNRAMPKKSRNLDNGNSSN